LGDWLDDRLSTLKSRESYSFSLNSKAKNIRAKLDANENWHIPAEEVNRLVREAVAQVDVRRYPLGIVDEFRVAVAEHLSLSERMIVPTQGADQGIDLLVQGFLREGNRAIIVGPTYSFYELRASLAGARCSEVKLNDDFSLPVDAILKEANDEGIIFVCSPNNPTGNQFAFDDVLRLSENFRGLVVLDEAYVDFASNSLVKEVENRRNLAILRTFSKAYGLADIRLGLIIAHPDWASLILDRIQYPYPLSGVVVSIALRMLQEFQLVENSVASLRKERVWLLERLKEVDGARAFDSQTNFVLLSLPIDTTRAFNALLERGIATKKVGRVLNLPNCIRVTVGTRAMNSEFLEALKAVLNDA
jgi:histidinol-phosphate aminotransferase